MKRLISFVLLIFIVTACFVGCDSADQPMSPGYEAEVDFLNGTLAFNFFDFVWNEEENGYFVYEKDDIPYMDIVIPDSYNGQPVVGIGRHAFGAYSKVRNVIVPDTVRIIESQAFNYCDYLEKVVFSKSSELLTVSDYAFFNCKTITVINLPASVRNIGYRAFSTCPSIVNLNVDEDNMNYCSQNSAIYSKDMKKLIAVAPASYISSDIVPDGETSMSEIIIPDGVEIIGAGAFADCYLLESIHIPDSVTTIEKGAFMGCTNFKSVIFGENSSLVSIGEGAFRDCPLLETIFIPKGVGVIGRYAFYCDNKLTTFDFAGSVSEWNAIEKGEKWDVNTGNYVVNCNDGALHKGE